MARLKTRGLVLRRLPYSESSQIVWLFTKERGVVHALAKGVLRPPRKNASVATGFDLAGWYDVQLRRGRGDLYQVFDGRLVEGFDHLRRDLGVYLDACLAMEVLLKAFSPEDPHEEFLREVLSYFKLLGVGQGRRALRLHFHARLLREWGAEPSWERCAASGRVAPDNAGERTVRVPVGLVVEAHRSGDLRVAPGVVDYLAAERRIPWGRVPSLDPGADTLRSAWRLIRGCLLYHLEHAPRTLARIIE